MEMSRFIEAFRCLPTTDSRQHALDALAGELTPHEWRALHTLLSARTFQLDIVGQLPLELVAQIFSHLDIAHPYRLQLVSRRWYYIMRSLTVLRVGLYNWYHDTVDLHHLDFKMCKQMAQRIQAFRTGKPCSHFLIRFDRPVMDPILTRDAVIWWPGDFRSMARARFICVLNLSTWKFRKFCGEAREAVRSFVASDEIVALMTYTNICYVWELHGEGSKSFKVPSQAYFGCTTCRDRTVACVAVGAEYTSVFIWHFDSHRRQSFQIKNNRQIPEGLPLGGCMDFSGRSTDYLNRSTRILLQPKTSSIIIIAHAWAFGLVVRDEKMLKHGPLVSNRFNYDGVCIDRSYLTLNSQFPEIALIDEQGWQALRLIPIDQQGHFTLEVKCVSASEREKVWLEFDEHLNQFTATSERSWSESSTNWWNDTFYKPSAFTWNFARGAAKQGLRVGNASGYERYILSVLESGEPPDLETYRDEQHMTDRYVVHILEDALLVYGFDESDDQPKGDGPFFTEGEFIALGTVVKSDSIFDQV